MHIFPRKEKKKIYSFFLFLLGIALILMRLSGAHSHTRHTRIDSRVRTNHTVVL